MTEKEQRKIVSDERKGYSVLRPDEQVGRSYNEKGIASLFYQSQNEFDFSFESERVRAEVEKHVRNYITHKVRKNSA